MARIRTIKPEFPQSETMGKVSRDARLLFILLWTIADDLGRTRGASRMLASLLFPYDDDARDLIPAWLDELEDAAAIRRYVVDGDTYLEIRNWLKHQKIDKPSGPKCPGFDEGSPRPRESSPPDMDRDRDMDHDRDRDRSLSAAPTAAGPPPAAWRDTTASPRQEPPATQPPAADVQRVFDAWRSTWNHPRAALDAKRRKLIAERLRDYSAEDLCRSIAGYRNSPHHCGQNDRATVYDALELFLRDAQHVDAGLRFADQPPRADQSALTRRNVAAVEDWVPPEDRLAAS